MGLLDAVFGGGTDPSSETETDESASKYAILLNAGPDDASTAANAFNYAIEFDDADHEVQVFLDGTAAKWPAEFAENPDRPFHHEWETLQQRGVLAGACGYCANAFDAAEACERAGVPVLSDKSVHAPAVAELAEQDYEILTVG